MILFHFLNYVTEDVCAVMGLYSESGTLLGTDYITISKGAVNAEFHIPYDGMDKELYAKVILIDSPENIKPVGKAQSVWVTEMITESNHPYANNINETNVISTTRNCESISITFSEDTYTEYGCDTITISDKDGEIIGTYSGNSLSNKTITVPGNTVRITLKTDSSVKEYGYAITSIVVNE